MCHAGLNVSAVHALCPACASGEGNTRCAGARFDPHEALQLAHRYQDAVDELPPPEVTGSEAVRVSHSISTRLSDRLLPLPSTLAAIGADAYDEDAWDDSDYDEDDAAAAFDALDVSVASGRAPPHRTARRRS